MKRFFVFLIAAPLAVALTAALAVVASGGPGDFARFFAVALFLLTLPVVAFAAAVDGFAARAFPIALRAPLVATVGAMIAYALPFTLLHWFLPTSLSGFFALGGAVSMGLCSLLAHDYSGEQRPSISAGI